MIMEQGSQPPDSGGRGAKKMNNKLTKIKTQNL
jgi:hypothetical protein